MLKNFLQNSQNMVNRHNQNKILPPMTQFYTQQSSTSNLNNVPGGSVHRLSLPLVGGGDPRDGAS